LQRVAGKSGGGNDVFLQSSAARAAALLGDRAALDTAVAALGSLRVTEIEGNHARAIEAAAAAAAGRWDEAHAAYRAALAGFARSEENLEAALLRLEQDAYLGARFPDARAGGEEAAAWFAEREAEGVVERYRAAFKGTPAPPAGAPAAAKKVLPVDAELPA
jgi:hypothetical protein